MCLSSRTSFSLVTLCGKEDPDLGPKVNRVRPKPWGPHHPQNSKGSWCYLQIYHSQLGDFIEAIDRWVITRSSKPLEIRLKRPIILGCLILSSLLPHEKIPKPHDPGPWVKKLKKTRAEALIGSLFNKTQFTLRVDFCKILLPEATRPSGNFCFLSLFFKIEGY